MESNDLMRQQIYQYLLEKAEKALNAETVARDTYLTIKGVDGTQNVGDIKNGYQVYSYWWGVTNTGIRSGALSGGGPAFRDLYVIVGFEKGLASAFQYMTQGKPIDEVQITFMDQQTKSIGDLKLEKSGDSSVRISDIHVVRVNSKENRPIVIIGFSYAKLNVEIGSAKGNYDLTSGKGG